MSKVEKYAWFFAGFAVGIVCLLVFGLLTEQQPLQVTCPQADNSFYQQLTEEMQKSGYGTTNQ